MRHLWPLLLLCVTGCIERHSPAPIGNVDSESHWLRPCVGDAQCGGLQCVCGICSRTCLDLDCGGDAQCAFIGADTCDAVPACTVECLADDDCPGAMRCLEGVCDAPAACAADGECPAETVCRDTRCVPIEICGDDVDQDGDGGDCADPDCISDPLCAATAERFAAHPAIVTCGEPDDLPDPADPAAALAATAEADAARIAELLRAAAALSTAAVDLETPALGTPLAEAGRLLADAQAILADHPVEDCAAPDCDPTALMRAELSLLGDAMDALDRVDPANDVILPYADCILATARLRFWRRSRHLSLVCPQHDAMSYDLPIGVWRNWPHQPSQRLDARCVFRAGHDICADVIGADVIGGEEGCE